MSVAIPVPQPQRNPVDGMQLHNSSRIPQYYYQAQASNFNQISKTATNLLNDKQHQYIFVQPSTAGPYFKFPPPPAPPPYPKLPVAPPYPKQNEPLPRLPLSKPSTPTQHLYETIPDKPPIPIPRPRESQVPSNRTQKKRAPSGHHHNSQSNMSHQRKHMSMNEQQQLQLHLQQQHHHQQQQQHQQLHYQQQQLQKPIVSNISSGIQYNNEQRTSADGGVAQPHYSYGKQQQQHQQQQYHQHQHHRNHNEKGLQPLPPPLMVVVEKDVREMPVGSAGELYDTRYIEEKIKESLLDNNNSRLPILYEEADGGAQHQHPHHQNDGSRIMVTKYAYRNSQIDLMAETAQAVAAASYYSSR